MTSPTPEWICPDCGSQMHSIDELKQHAGAHPPRDGDRCHARLGGSATTCTYIYNHAGQHTWEDSPLYAIRILAPILERIATSLELLAESLTNIDEAGKLHKNPRRST